MNIIKLFFFLMLFLSAFACTNSPSSPKVESRENLLAEEEAIKETLIKMWEAIEYEEVEKYAEFIHPDFTQFGEMDSSLNIGKEKEVEGVRGWLENASNIHTEMLEPRVVVKGSVAWITYYWKDQGISQGKKFSSGGKSSRIFVKEDGKWLCIHGHYTLFP